MTSSMSRIAISRPSTRCSRSAALLAAEERAAAYDVEAVLEEDLEHLLEPERARLAVDQGDGVDAEGVLHRRLLVELLEQRLGDEAVLDLDHQPQPVAAVGEVLDVGDALELLALHQRS